MQSSASSHVRKLHENVPVLSVLQTFTCKAAPSESSIEVLGYLYTLREMPGSNLDKDKDCLYGRRGSPQFGL
jgi:hypothetical protein